mmetsp:Transcript_47535/g.140411  ORF Transcript_47535/g.140411 Transcript_47535/m.140411 type:complete len:288 (+) Transcript_47535:3-866(+)
MIGDANCFSGPDSVNTMPDGTLCVADTANKRLQVIRPSGEVLRTVQFRQSLGELKFHTGLAADADAFYVVDNANHALRKLALADGAPIAQVSKWGSGDSRLSFPEGLALLKRRVFIADCGNHRIAVFDSSLTFCESFGRRGSGPGELNGPCGLAVDESLGELYVADSGNHRLAVFSGAGAFVRLVGSKGAAPGCFIDPCGIALAHGHLYVAEYEGRRLQVLTRLGAPLQIVQVPGGEMLAGICAGYSTMFVADPRGNVLHVLEVATHDTGQPSQRAIVPRTVGAGRL